MLAMNGFHALRPHNRKYYYNSFLSNFEPIYYDGMIKFSDLDKNPFKHSLDDIMSVAFKKPLNRGFINKLISVANSKELKKEFFKRVEYKYKDKEIFFEKSILFFLSNINKLDEMIENNSNLLQNEKNFQSNLKFYQTFQKKKNISQKIISNIELMDKNYLLRYKSGNTKELNHKKISKMLSSNIIDKNRAIYLTTDDLITILIIIKEKYKILKYIKNSLTSNKYFCK